MSELDEKDLGALVQETFVVIPVYNEADVLQDVLTEVRAEFPNVVVVDDASTDSSAAIALECKCHLLKHVVNRGQGASLQTGIRYALERGARYIITFDSDGQHAVSDALEIAKKLNENKFNVVLGSRFLDENSTKTMPSSRKLLLSLAIFFMKIRTGLNLSDTHNGLRGFSAEAATKMTISLDRMAHASEILDNIAEKELSYCEHPVSIIYSDYSLSKGQKARNALSILQEYFFRGAR